MQDQAGPREFTKLNMPGCSPKVQQQPNFSDCGIYLLQYVESFFKTPILDYTLPITSLKTWFPEDEVRNKRAKIASLIRQLATGQNPEKNFSYPEIMFDGEDNNGEVVPCDDSEENEEEGKEETTKETSESPIVETAEDSQMQQQQPTSNGMTTVQNVVRITGTNFVTAGSPVSGVATSTSTTLPMPQPPPQGGGVNIQQAAAPVQQVPTNKQQYTLVRKNGNQVRVGPVTMPAGVTVTPAVINTNGPNVVSSPAMNSIKLAAAPVVGNPVAVGGPVAVQSQPTPVKLINMSSNNIQLANRKLTIVSSNQPQQGIVHVQQHQPMPQQTTVATVQLQHPQPQHHVVVQQHPQQHHHMVQQQQQQQQHHGMVQHHGHGMVQQHPQQYHPQQQHHYQYQQQQQQQQQQQPQQHTMHVMQSQQQVLLNFYHPY